jgi:hypothetical protein
MRLCLVRLDLLQGECLLAGVALLESVKRHGLNRPAAGTQVWNAKKKAEH